MAVMTKTSGMTKVWVTGMTRVTGMNGMSNGVG